MAILLKPGARVVVQNALSAYGREMIPLMREAGTQLVAGVAPGHGGREAQGLPVFDTVAEACAATGADTSVIYTPPFGVADAIVEAAAAGIALAVAAAEHAPVHDVMPALAFARERGMWVVGPNSLGLLSPGVGMLCGLPPAFGLPGRVGLISRSGTLSIVMLRTLSAAGIGQSTAVSIGGDGVIGRRPVEYVELFDADPATDAVVVVGEIGGGKEAELAEATARFETPVVAMIVGRSAPQGRRFGHAGALAGSPAETADAKMALLREAGATVCTSPAEVVEALRGLPAPVGARRQGRCEATT
ncbi:succinate--CoA ligase subunit alpha [Lutibaculum baratangense]|nr:CoA-binding protein [Lutibaculum baratangense]